MPRNAFNLLITFSFLCFNSFYFNSAQASDIFQPLGIGSYQKILQKRSDRDLLVVFWSIDCPPCIKELKDLRDLHKDKPQYQLTLINTDSTENIKNLESVLLEHRLLDVDNWIFSHRNTAKLRFEIDPRWYGDLPRSYFFSTTGKHKRLKGALSKQRLYQLFDTTT